MPSAFTPRLAAERGWIDVAPIGRLLDDWCKLQAREDGHEDMMAYRDYGAVAQQEGVVLHFAALRRLEMWSGVNYYTLEKIRYGTKKFVDFDTADRIVIYTFGPEAWRTRSDLREVYESFDLSGIDRRRPCVQMEEAA